MTSRRERHDKDDALDFAERAEALEEICRADRQAMTMMARAAETAEVRAEALARQVARLRTAIQRILVAFECEAAAMKAQRFADQREALRELHAALADCA